MAGSECGEEKNVGIWDNRRRWRNGMQIVMRKLGDIHPYEKNPRKNEKAVEYVAKSIKEFGLLVPLVLDKNDVIAAGDTRYKAAKKLK